MNAPCLLAQTYALFDLTGEWIPSANVNGSMSVARADDVVSGCLKNATDHYAMPSQLPVSIC